VLPGKGSSLSPSNLESFLQSYKADTQLQEIQEPVRAELDEVEALIHRFFESDIHLIRGISRQLLGVMGKKFRPTLLLLVSHVGAPRRDDALFGAAVIELIHTATLIHDDTIDRSALRRGLPTINALYNDLVATILGDYIYTKAFNELLERNLPQVVPVVARTTYRMSIGEMLQLQQKHDLNVTAEEYFQLVDEKTASLMAASTEVGALLAGLGDERVLRYRRFGQALGRAYQVTDDLFDFLGSPDVIGKGVQSDLAEGTFTLPLIHALAHAPAKERSRLRDLAVSKDLQADDWRTLLKILETSGAIAHCREQACALAEEALAAIEEEPASPWKKALERAVAYAVQRIH